MQLRTELQRHYPHVVVEAAHHPPTRLGQLGATACNVGKFGLIAAAAAGDSIASSLGVAPPPALQSLQQNRMAVIGGAWFFGSSLSQSFLKTGAFEVTLDGELVWCERMHAPLSPVCPALTRPRTPARTGRASQQADRPTGRTRCCRRSAVPAWGGGGSRQTNSITATRRADTQHSSSPSPHRARNS